ncbi:MAG: D-aminoacyl-tRNA deacylase [Planctomycetota bacterium]|nr:D-aminoacyl-tRNA deacylase [Planctomycetota bacterium]
MIAVVQRVTSASVTVKATKYHESIEAGLCVLLCAEHGDTDQEAKWMAQKLARLRIFWDEQDKMNRSIQDAGGEILLISQFTLAGDCNKGNRPSFIRAADPEQGEKLYQQVAFFLNDEQKLVVKTGQFGAMMQINILNDGPVTIILAKGKYHTD